MGTGALSLCVYFLGSARAGNRSTKGASRKAAFPDRPKAEGIGKSVKDSVYAIVSAQFLTGKVSKHLGKGPQEPSK